MRCIARWINLFLLASVLMLSACAGKPEKSISTPSLVASDISRASNVSPLVKRDYEQALVYMQKGDYNQAEALLTDIVNKDQSLAGPYINLGIIRLKQDDFNKAEKLFLDAEARNPANAEVQNYLGIIYRQQGRFIEAEQAYKKAIRLKPMFAKAYLNLGVLNDLYLGNYKAALRNYEQYLVFNPEDKKVESWIIDLNQRMQATNL